MKKTIAVSVCLAVASVALAEIATTNNSANAPKVFIAPTNGAETYIAAAIQRKRVPVTVVTDQDQADYILEMHAETQKAGWAKILIAGDLRSTEDASIRLVDVKTKTVVFAYSYHAGSSWFGKQSSAESCAKHLGQWFRER